MSEIQIAENAAREYLQNVRNPWFKGKPEEKFKLLTRIILGAHNLIEDTRKSAPKPDNEIGGPNDYSYGT